MKNTNKILFAGLCLAFTSCQKPVESLAPTSAINHSAARIGNGGCMLNAQDDGSFMAFNYNADGSPASAVIDGYLVQYDEIKDGLITKLSYGSGATARKINVEYDSHRRPIKAFKSVTSDFFNYTANFNVSYNAQGRLATLVVDFDGDQDVTMAHRLVYNPKGNVVAHYIAENGGPEYLWTQLSQYDNRKNFSEEVALHPINLFYEPAGIARLQSANNAGRLDQMAENSYYFGTFIGWDEYKNLAYSPQGYPTQVQNDFDYNYVTFDFHIIDSWSYGFSYLCPGDNAPGKQGKGGAKGKGKSFSKRKLN
jgi:hypothetical protein